MDEMNPIDEVFALFDERDLVRQTINQKIFELLKPTVFTALFDLFDVPADDVQWQGMEMQDMQLVITVNVTYKISPTMSMFLKLMDKAANATALASNRTLRVSVPLEFLFDPVEDLKRFFMEMALIVAGPIDEVVTVTKSAQHFKLEELTKEQLQQMLLFQQSVSGEKQ